MVAFNTVGRLNRTTDLSLLQRELATELGEELMFQLLPQLADVVLPIVDSMGTTCDLATMLQQSAFLTLSGAPGSGRKLALLQVAQRWVNNRAPQLPAPVRIMLPLLDDDRSRPSVLLEPWLPAAAAPTTKQKRGPFSLLRFGPPTPVTPAPEPRWLLLISGFEELSADRRSAWRATLSEAPQRWPDLRVLISIPQDEPAWPGYTALTIGAPAPKLVQRWIEQLAAPEHREEIAAALAPSGPLHSLSDRLIDVVLLIWQSQRGSLPTTRAGLYKRVLEDILSLQETGVDRQSQIAALQLLAAYGEQPNFTLPNLIEAKDDQTVYFIYPQARRYLAARQLVEEERFDLLHQVDQIERDELARLIATMLVDPSPLYVTLWQNGHPRPDDVLVLGHCLRERVPPCSTWTLRITGALVRLTRAGTPEQRSAARAVLLSIGSLLATELPNLANAGESGQQTLLRLLTAMPDDIAAPHIARLAYDSTIPETLAWSLADRLLELPVEADSVPPGDPAALARWAFVQANRSARTRQLLAPHADEALSALFTSSAGEGRRRRVANAILDDATLPLDAHLAAVKLLGDTRHPASSEVIERALHDQSVEVQRHAIDALAAQPINKALNTLSRTIFDAHAPWEARMSALQHITKHAGPEANDLLVSCVRNAELPLYMRIHAVEALGNADANVAALLALAGDAQVHPELRITAVHVLGRSEQSHVIDELQTLLYGPDLPFGLAEAICDALGQLGQRHERIAQVSFTLMHVLNSVTTDVGLTLAVIRALGVLGDESAIEPLSQLLRAEALARLQRGLPSHIQDLSAQECLEAAELPATIKMRLALACAEGASPADRPSTLGEFLVSEADLIRAGAAASLVAIGGASVRSAIIEALLSGESGGATDELITTLAEVDGAKSAETLAELIVAAEASPLTRWLAVRHLADHPQGNLAMQQVLMRHDVDAFTRGALAEALGQRRDLSALPLLLQLVDDHTTDTHLRSQAVLALGLLDHPDTEPALLRLLSNASEDETMRGLAAEHLPSQLSEQARHELRDMLRRERMPVRIQVGLLQALRRAHDHESLPLMLRYAQDERADVAQMAIAGVAVLGDSTITPNLVRISQDPNAERAVRIEAVGALLRLGGPEFRTLLRGYLEQGALPLRLQALEHLINTSNSATELLNILTDRSWPLLLRLRILERFGDQPQALDALLEIVGSADDDEHLRCLAAELLGRAGYTPALSTLLRLVEQDTTSPSRMLHWINSIGAIGGSLAWLELGRIAEDPNRSADVRHWATLALRRVKQPENELDRRAVSLQ